MRYAVGKITNTHGVRGEVKVKSETDFNRFEVKKSIIVNNDVLTIKSVRTQNQYLLISFEGLDNINDVLKYKGLTIYTDQKPMIKDQDTYYLPDLIGKQVYQTNRQLVGVVDRLMDVPQGHILVIIKPDGKKSLVPFIKEFIKDIDQEKIIIEPIEGLV